MTDTDISCKEVLPKGPSVTRYYCERTAEYYCSKADGPKCLDHSHLAGCCERLYWPDKKEIEARANP